MKKFPLHLFSEHINLTKIKTKILVLKANDNKWDYIPAATKEELENILIDVNDKLKQLKEYANDF